MKELVNIRDLEQAKVLLNPIRIQLLQKLATARTCAELAADMGLTQQRVNGHLKEMLSKKIIRISKKRQVRNLIEATYIATGKAYWFSPRILRDPDMEDQKFRDQLSLNNLLIIAESIQDDVGRLLEQTEDEDIPSVGVSGEVFLKDEAERKAFTKDFLKALTGVLEKYQGPDAGRTCYKFSFMCYPEAKK